MAGKFADLMALSASQTREADLTAQSLLLERQRKEEAKRKEREEIDKRQREAEARRVQREIEKVKEAVVRSAKAEEEKLRKEQLLKKREEEMRQALVYGKPSRSGGGSRSNGTPRAPRERRKGSDSEAELDPGAMALTREEKKRRKLMADLSKGSSSSSSSRKSTSAFSAPKRQGQVLKGGAVNIDITVPVNSSTPKPSNEHLSVKERIAADPHYLGLRKLNTVKRDTRTIDEILRDRQREREGMVLNGEDAKGYHDWFSSKSKASLKNAASSQPTPSPSSSRPLTPNPPSSSQPKPVTSATKPTTSSSLRLDRNAPSRSDSSTGTAKNKVTTKAPLPSFQKGLSKGSSTLSTSASTKASSGSKVTATSSLARTSTAANPRKRTHSESLDDSEFDSGSFSDSPPPSKQRRPGASSSSGRNTISSEIWKIFGKDRNQYMSADVFSDDEDDMEVNADMLRKEELRSARIAKKEDEDAVREEARHEEEKRRRKREKELRDKRA